MISISQNTLSDAAQLIGTAVILWIGFSLVLSQQITIGALMSFYALMSYFTTPVKNLIELQPKMQTAFVAADRLDDILEQEIEKIDSGTDEMPLINSWELKNIDFRYGNRELVLQDVSISIQRGQKVALVGESGSGKTTIAKLLLDFYTPEKGSIEVGGQPIEKIGIGALRSSIAYVDQNTFLFADTIKNNLKLGNPDVTDDDIISSPTQTNISLRSRWDMIHRYMKTAPICRAVKDSGLQ